MSEGLSPVFTCPDSMQKAVSRDCLAVLWRECQFLGIWERKLGKERGGDLPVRDGTNMLRKSNNPLRRLNHNSCMMNQRPMLHL